MFQRAHLFRLSLKALTACFFLAFPPAVFSAPLSPLHTPVAGCSCFPYLRYAESYYRIPPGLLTALALTESGTSAYGTYQPWPWTVQTGGRSYLFKTKREAISFVSNLLKRGQRNIDVGCMQINLRNHPEAFKKGTHGIDLERAFDPGSNIAYGAFFLIGLKKNRSWRDAVRAYHTRDPSAARRLMAYESKVMNHWRWVKQSQGSQPTYPVPGPLAAKPSKKPHLLFVKDLPRNAAGVLVIPSAKNHPLYHASASSNPS